MLLGKRHLKTHAAVGAVDDALQLPVPQISGVKACLRLALGRGAPINGGGGIVGVGGAAAAKM